MQAARRSHPVKVWQVPTPVHKSNKHSTQPLFSSTDEQPISNQGTSSCACSSTPASRTLRYRGTAAVPNEVLLRSPNCHRSSSVAELDKGLITRRLQNAQLFARAWNIKALRCLQHIFLTHTCSFFKSWAPFLSQSPNRNNQLQEPG